ncbi:MAG: excinuclease ABC subunit UvrA [bacterium]
MNLSFKNNNFIIDNEIKLRENFFKDPEIESFIDIVNVRQNNLKGINLRIPHNVITVICGVSGSGKSSLAYEVIYSEGQRRYLEAISNYARQFLNKLEKPNVDKIEGLRPTISIDQRIKNLNPRSTVGTITEIYDYLRLIYASIGIPFCPFCNVVISKLEPQEIVEQILSNYEGKKISILAPVIRYKKGDHKITLNKIKKLGFTKIIVNGIKFDIDDEIELNKYEKHNIDVIIDSLVVNENNKGRLLNSVSLAMDTTLKLSIDKEKQKLVKIYVDDKYLLYSGSFSCYNCGFSYPEISWRLFSFNTPLGACEKCKGLGSVIDFNLNKVIDYELSIKDGAIKIFPKNQYSWYKLNYWWEKIRNFCYANDIDINKPLKNIENEKIQKLIYGDSHFEGIRAFVNELYFNYDFDLSNLVFERVCSDCNGYRLNNVALSVKLKTKDDLYYSIGDLASKPVYQIKNILNNLDLNQNQRDIIQNLLDEVLKRLDFIIELDLGYLDLYRTASNLSSGEAQRIKLASQLGSQLSGIIYVLDEPTIGLHPYNIDKVIKSILKLKELNNTIIIVEHDKQVISNADFLVELGYEGGQNGGYVIFADFLHKYFELFKNFKTDFIENISKNPNNREIKFNEFDNIENDKKNNIGFIDLSESLKKEISNLYQRFLNSPTLRYLFNKDEVKIMNKDYLEKFKEMNYIYLKNVRLNNLKNISLRIPLNRLTVITGVSGSGKTSILDALYFNLASKLNQEVISVLDEGVYGDIEFNKEKITKVSYVDQKPIGKTPRSTVATYTKIFDEIRSIFANLPESKRLGFRPSRFSYNLPDGRCDKCKGEGFIRLDMNFLPDLYIKCEACDGKRYNLETLMVKFDNKYSIYDVLELTVKEAIEVFKGFKNVEDKLKFLDDIGLGYIKLGQISPSLSGGESQRIKLAYELSKRNVNKTIYLLDEPTTGLHYLDIQKFLDVIYQLLSKGATIVIVEHNIEVIKNADYIIEVGPKAAYEGGYIIFQGTYQEFINSDTLTKKYVLNEII